MQRSSDTIGTIAAALAKAQAQLVNPEKSLVATIRSDETNGSERSFRYAPLSTGLDIVRKTLGRHEIATVQTTSIDETAGIVRLSTVLAHASGEWIGSDWPVCAISETATPHRMGAALTYARRYGLFTLVGIAGEDDLDAPDLIAPTTPASMAVSTVGNRNDHLNGGRGQSGQRFSTRRAPKTSKPSPTILEPEASAALRDQLTAEIEDLNSAEEAANWAHRVLEAKDTLIVADATCVETAFQAALGRFASDAVDESPMHQSQSPLTLPARSKKRRASTVVDKSVLSFPAPRRIRDREHVKSVAKEPCLVCGRRPADTHHLRSAQSPALGRKVSDEFTVPLCRGHHREVHHCSDEAAWWERIGIDPNASARTLWLKTHPLLPAHIGPKGHDFRSGHQQPTARQQAQSTCRSTGANLQNKANFRKRLAMTSFRQIEANRHNALKSTGPRTEAGKQQSRCNAVRHGLTAETVIGALEDAEDYQAFESTIIADYDAQSAVERQLVLRLASLLWRLRRATIMETGLFEIQAEHLRGHRQARLLLPRSRDVIHAVSGHAESDTRGADGISPNDKNNLETVPAFAMTCDGPAIEVARCFLRLANLPNFALDRLSRYEVNLWRQTDQILFALDIIDRRKPQERMRRFPVGD